MTIFDRAREIIMNPRVTWQAIKGEAIDLKQVFLNYAAPLALIPAVSSLIGISLFGLRMPAGHLIRAPFFESLLVSVLTYAVSLLAIYITGYIIYGLAPYFGSKADLNLAMKLVIYSATPFWLAGIFSILPGLGILSILGLYGVYLMVVGLPELLGTPPDKVIWYTAAIIISLIVVNFILSTVIVASVFGPMYMRMMAL